jgi:hypothetical protein
VIIRKTKNSIHMGGQLHKTSSTSWSSRDPVCSIFSGLHLRYYFCVVFIGSYIRKNHVLLPINMLCKYVLLKQLLLKSPEDSAP